ncbi:ComEC/Rec2 family competence protein [filamentous cyanobacterium LEGE 11480]|uniref:ComEC/Rec2 family competence protein n=1 Tax=Romeriopsis navalis LEGE 11480 TaxID=2777977 RepID=A0A928Z4I3_9CYAN|nr:ComEC/Rec2 family competence protein [Romeriopsis navalis]MBE9032656.1 ComEC/Rec2 family competence protein [Romeriopsis navalis LEGE 11480]
MQITTIVWLCLAYMLGLVATGLAIAQPWLGIGLLLVGVAFEFSFRRWWRARLPVWFCLIMAGVALVATLHYQWRLPQPGSTDVSRFVPVLRSREVIVQGVVESLPRLTRSEQMQIWLQVEGLDVGPLAPRLTTSPALARGRLYVTVPPAVGADVHPGLKVKVKGNLYRPQAAKNPDGFDFQQFLRRQNSFAGLRGESLEFEAQPQRWGLWQIQRRIIRAQAVKLPAPEGAMLSAIVLGGRVVDLPFALKDQFAQVGLAHVLAASGFHVALLLNAVLWLTQRLSSRWRFGLGAVALLLFLGLTGLQPSVCRAVVMGFAVLLAVVVDRQVDALRSLLGATTLLLIANPLWMWDLGFQFSVLATLGLIVTVPWLMQGLTWLPQGIAGALAVPIAAFIWTVPLQLHTFGVMSPYSLLVNLSTTPLVIVISLGGILNALLAVLWPVAASWSSLLLHYPIALLLAIVELASRLPGSLVVVGALPLGLMLLLYGLVAVLWIRIDWRQFGWAFGLAGAALVWLPSLHWQNHVTQVTALATRDQPVLVVQDRGKTGLVNSGKARTASLTVLPFLQQQGVSRLDWAIALSRQGQPQDQPTGWQALADRFGLGHLHHVSQAVALPQSQMLAVDRSVKLGRSRGSQVSASPDVLSLRVAKQRWLLFAGLPGRAQPDLVSVSGLQNHQVMWWPGGRLRQSLVGQIQPNVAIAYGRRLDTLTEEMLERQGVQVFWLKRDGAVQWREGKGFRSTLTGVDAKGVLL